MSTDGVRILAGVTPDTFRHQQLGPGLLLKNFEYETIATAEAFRAAFTEAIREGQSLGGTDGGFEINITPTFRKRQVDGANMPFRGDEVIDEWTCEMSTILKEFTPTTLQAAFPTSEFALVGTDIVAMRIRSAIEDEDHADNFTAIMTTDYGWLMVAMFNALGRTTGAINTEDRSEGDIPFQVNGKIGDFEAIDFAPAEIWMVDRTTGGIIRNKVGAGGE